MGKVILYIATSLDGYIAREDGDVSWLDAYQGEKGEDYGYSEFYKSIGTVISGSKTYEVTLSLGGADSFSNKKLYVITRRELEKPAKANIEFYSGDLTRLVKSIKASSDKDIWLLGGGKLIGSFVNESLIDEFMIFVVPIILGEGIALFQNTEKEAELRLMGSKQYLSGLVLLHYTPK